MFLSCTPRRLKDNQSVRYYQKADLKVTRTETRKSVNMSHSRRHLIISASGIRIYEVCLGCEQRKYWVKILVAYVVECLENFKEMRKSLF